MTISYGVSIKMEGSDLTMRLGFKENEILRGSIASPFMRAPLLRVVPVKSRYGHTTCVTYEQPQFLPLRKFNIQTLEINIRSNTSELVSFESGKSIVKLVFRRQSFFSLMYQFLEFKGSVC